MNLMGCERVNGTDRRVHGGIGHCLRYRKATKLTLRMSMTAKLCTVAQTVPYFGMDWCFGAELQIVDVDADARECLT